MIAEFGDGVQDACRFRGDFGSYAVAGKEDDVRFHGAGRLSVGLRGAAGTQHREEPA